MPFEFKTIIVDVRNVGDAAVKWHRICLNVLEVTMNVIERRCIEPQCISEKRVLGSYLVSVVGLGLKVGRDQLLSVAAVDPARLVAPRDARID